MSAFDPNAAAPPNSGIFGLPFTQDQASLVFLPVPWEATTSYGGGTAEGPEAICEASHQVDLYDLSVQRPYEAGLFMLPFTDSGFQNIKQWNAAARQKAQRVIDAGGVNEEEPDLLSAAKMVNKLSAQLNDHVRNETRKILNEGKIAAIVGGDHSVPFGALQAIAERHPSFGVLHFDAHSDTRRAYEGFTWSHASIMFNVLEQIPEVTKLVQVGIRDFCEEESDYCRSQGKRVSVFYDEHLIQNQFEGHSWKQTTQKIISELPPEVWISFDIDGLDARYCPHTGTPVPGGLEFQQALYVIAAVARSGRKIIGFDVNEVSPGTEDEWDANVGARLLYKLSAWTLYSQGKCQLIS